MRSNLQLPLTLALYGATLTLAAPKYGPIGAAYFMSNTPNGRNYIVALGLTSDGGLDETFASTTATGGVGGSGINTGEPAGPHADSLYTQDSVRVAGSYLFAVNAGSNTLSMFTIDVKNPTKITLVSTVGSGGEFPAAVGVNEEKTMACVVNGGAENCLACFTIDPENGLIPIVGSKRPLGITQTTPPAGPENTVSDVVFDNDGNILLSVKGFNGTAPGYLGRVTVTNGTLSPAIEKINPNGGALPFSITTPKSLGDGHIIFTTDPGIGVVTYDLSSSPIKNNGTVIPGQKASCWSEYSTQTKTFFTTDIATSHLVELSVDPATFVTSIVKNYTFPNTTLITDVAISSTYMGQFLHILSPDPQVIITMDVGTGAGHAKIIQTLEIAKIVKKNSGLVLSKSMNGLAVFMAPSA